MDRLIEHVLKTNVGRYASTVPKKSVMGLLCVQNVRIQTICHRARSVVQLRTNVFVIMDFIVTQVFFLFFNTSFCNIKYF